MEYVPLIQNMYFKFQTQTKNALYLTIYSIIIHTIFLHKDDIQNLKVPSKLWRVSLTCAHATNQIQKEGWSHAQDE